MFDIKDKQLVKYLSIISLCFLVSVPSPASHGRVESDQTVSKQIASLDRAMQSLLDKHALTGGVIAGSFRGRMVIERSYGLSKKSLFGQPEPARVEQVWRIASISKTLTGIAVLTLVEAGKLSLDETFINILDPDRGWNLRDPRVASITVRQLLQHRSGFFKTRDDDPQTDRSPPCPRGLKGYVERRDLLEAPGSSYVYSNFGYCILGEVIRARAGMEPENYFQEIFSQVGIGSLTFGNLRDRARDEVQYQRSLDETRDPYNSYDFDSLGTAGGVVIRARDLLQILDELTYFPNRLLKSEDSWQAFIQPDSHEVSQPVHYGLGVRVRKLPQGRVNIFHSGSLVGTTTHFAKYADGWTIVAFFNQRIRDYSKLSADIDQVLSAAKRP